ncbi:SDR family NAD(P)-dependent oxidoreductase [Euzebya tangerina]|uniref:SDR family NAD(P)-dependent oxidoreductase n=1 Tax=Euzebya tangerina TaxID=591198 RepID=UPI0013C3634D|nr:SDR family NAD(P)-dependent oxidoreductase [Euzebya tangerina]
MTTAAQEPTGPLQAPPAPLEGTTAVVTGAAGGLGAAITGELLAQGARVLMVDRPGSGIDTSTAAEGTHALATDLTDDGAPAAVVTAAQEAFGALHILVNNAGVIRMASLRRTNDDNFDTTLAVNLRAAFRLTRAAVDVMRHQIDQAPDTRDRHAIVNIASVNGMGAYSGAHAYAASKAGIIGLTRSTARELGPHGIRVNAVAPGLIRTPMTHEPDGSPQPWVGEQVQGIPLRRVGEPADVARVVAFLASQNAAYVSAQVLKVDGGGLPEM